MIKLTLDKANELLDEAVAERGEDYVYRPPRPIQSCQYVHYDGQGNPSPGCIVGLVLTKAGISTDQLAQWEGNSAPSVLCELNADESNPFAYEEGVSELLASVQNLQDNRHPWGEAVREGRRRFTDHVKMAEYGLV